MSKTFNTRSKIEQVKEPLFQVSRARYRGSRSSHQENLETNLMKLDLTRIYAELQEIDDSILDQITLFVGDKRLMDEETILDDGITNQIEDVGLTSADPLTPGLDNVLDIDTIDKLNGILLKLMNKVQRLEMGM